VHADTDVWELRRGGEGFPRALEALEERAPARLYGRGNPDAVAWLEPGHAVTIVGARRASPYGREVAETLGRLLGAAGLTVVSGMARGIDAAAHRGALDGDAITVAVLGSGPDVIYPASERRLYGRILERGAVISEHPPGTKPGPGSFPERNRIMAALAEITVVVEAAERSGSRITAREAEGCNRTVGAVPGPVTSWLSAGSNQLLKDGAQMIRDAQDVLDLLLGVGATDVRNTGATLDPELAALLELVEAGNHQCDALAAESGASPAQLAVALARLELLGYVRADAAGRYARTALAAPD
jgi:DNA processing protein